MTAISTYGATGDPYLDGVLSGVKWAVSSLTFSFPSDPSFYGTSYGSGEPSTNFKAFTDVQQTAVRAVLQTYASVANVTFTEVPETASQHGELRYAESDSPGTAWAYYPTTSAAGGDAWFNNSKHYYDNPTKGNYAYLTMLHETGHAMGLKHPQDVKGAFGTMPLDHDSLEYTVMSYRSYVGASTTTGYTNGSTSYPQTLMMYDIAALQQMYGANYTTNSGNTVYKWDPATGQMFSDGAGEGAPAGNKIFMTLWDGGGNDTYDFSNYTTNLTVDLQPGHWTTVSTTQLAVLGSGHLAAGNIANALLYQDNPASLVENTIGGSGNDTIIGNSAANKLTGGHGNDLLDGGAGTDTAVYSGLLANYLLVHNADETWTITDLLSGSPDGMDTLLNIELLQFSDQLFTIGTAPPTPVNQAPVVTSGAQSASLTEWADLSANEGANTPQTTSGAITFTDADSTDLHSAAFAALGSGYLGTFSLNTGGIDSSDSVGWSFMVSDSAINYLKAGQTLTQLYDVTIDDGHGGTAIQTVTITINGADDATTKTNPGKGGKKGAGAEVSVGEWGPQGTPAELSSRSEKVGMAGDQAPAPVQQDAYSFDPWGPDLSFGSSPSAIRELVFGQLQHNGDLLLM